MAPLVLEMVVRFLGGRSLMIGPTRCISRVVLAWALM